MTIEDEHRQNRHLERLEADAEADVNSFRTVYERLDKERLRNDIQASRIKALTTLCERLVERLAASGAVPAVELAPELAELRKVSAPVKL